MPWSVGASLLDTKDEIKNASSYTMIEASFLIQREKWTFALKIGTYQLSE